MFKVVLQDDSNKTGFWVYIVNDMTGKQFMFKYKDFPHTYTDELKETIKSEDRDQAERLIKFMNYRVGSIDTGEFYND